MALLFTWRSNFLCEMPARGASLIIIYNYKLDSILKTFHLASENVQPGLSSLLYYRRLRFVLDFARCYYYKKNITSTIGHFCFQSFLLLP